MIFIANSLPLLLLTFVAESLVVNKSPVLLRFVIISNSSMSGDVFCKDIKNRF